MCYEHVVYTNIKGMMSQSKIVKQNVKCRLWVICNEKCVIFEDLGAEDI